MNQLTKTAKVTLLLTIVFGSLWLGSYLTKLLLIYQLFQGNEFELKDYLNDINLGAVLKTISSAFSAALILYPLFIVSFILFMFFSKLNLKRNGWLFIITMLIIITAPMEIYLLSINYKISMLSLTSPTPADEILKLIIKRMNVLGSFPLVEILCYFAIIFLIIFKPLHKDTV